MARTFFIDDEELARLRLRSLLSSYSEEEILGEAADGPEAMAFIEAGRHDVVFPDKF